MKIYNPDKPSFVNRPQFEMTLAEFPIFILNGKLSSKTKRIEYSDVITNPNGEHVKRDWVVNGHSRYNFGSQSTLELFYTLFEIWKQEQYEGKYIKFDSIYNIVKRMNKIPTSVTYNRVIRDLKTLIGITIDCKNAYWDHNAKGYVTTSFHLFESFRVLEGTAHKAFPFDMIEVSETLINGVKNNNMLTLYLDDTTFHSLSPLQQRLSLLLTKMFKVGKMDVYQRNLRKFIEMIPLSTNNIQSAKKNIVNAVEVLQDKGFDIVSNVYFEDKGKKAKIIFEGKNSTNAKANYDNLKKQVIKPNRSEEDIAELEYHIWQTCKDEHSAFFYSVIASFVRTTDIFRALRNAKEIKDMGNLKKTIGACFLNELKNIIGEAEYKRLQNIIPDKTGFVGLNFIEDEKRRKK